MKSKLTTIAALASIACTGFPLQAQTQQMVNRLDIITIIAVAQCHINAGKITEEIRDELIVATFEEKPHLKPAYTWAINSSNARAAVEDLALKFGPNCDGDVPNEFIENVILPNLN